MVPETDSEGKWMDFYWDIGRDGDCGGSDSKCSGSDGGCGGGNDRNYSDIALDDRGSSDFADLHLSGKKNMFLKLCYSYLLMCFTHQSVILTDCLKANKGKSIATNYIFICRSFCISLN